MFLFVVEIILLPSIQITKQKKYSVYNYKKHFYYISEYTVSFRWMVRICIESFCEKLTFKVI